MAKHINIILTTFLALTACSDRTIDKSVNQSTDTELKTQIIADTTNGLQDKVREDTLPIHGELNQKQIDQYYPKIIDTIKDRKIIGSEPIDIHTTADIYVSMLHNTGMFDQIFLCTHDKKFNLLDCYYIGTSTGFDKTSHTIEYKKMNDERLELHHVDWDYVKKNGKDEIDTLKYRKYILALTKTGRIEKK